jgi:hypothetical protein
VNSDGLVFAASSNITNRNSISIRASTGVYELGLNGDHGDCFSVATIKASANAAAGEIEVGAPVVIRAPFGMFNHRGMYVR